MWDELTPAPLEQLIELLQGVEVRATMNPGEVNTPGAWLALDEVRPLTLSGTLQLRCSLYLIGPDHPAAMALRKLAPLLSATMTVLTPDGPVTATNVVLPSGPTPLPALRVPVYLTT